MPLSFKERAEFGAMYRNLATIKAELRALRLHLRAKAYNPGQPRVPAGSPDGGQWAGEGGGGGASSQGGLFAGLYSMGDLIAEIPKAIGRLCIYQFDFASIAVEGPTHMSCQNRIPSSAATHGQILNDNRRKSRRMI